MTTRSRATPGIGAGWCSALEPRPTRRASATPSNRSSSDQISSTRRENKATLDEWITRLERCDGGGLASAIMGVVHREPVTSKLSRIAAPTLVIHGEGDGMPLARGREIAARIPGARFEALARCGHFCTLDKADEVTRLLGEFLAEH